MALRGEERLLSVTQRYGGWVYVNGTDGVHFFTQTTGVISAYHEGISLVLNTKATKYLALRPPGANFN